jgi:hypothetical protein
MLTNNRRVNVHCHETIYSMHICISKDKSNKMYSPENKLIFIDPSRGKEQDLIHVGEKYIKRDKLCCDCACSATIEI